MKEINARFSKETGAEVRFTAGSSGKLAAQIKEGAPFDVLLSANVVYVDEVIQAGVCAPDTKALYGRGRLVMWSGPDAKTPPPADLKGLEDPRYAHIAIANPEHAPYGAAAKKALEKVGVWNAVAPRLVYGSNIQETMQFAETGNAEVAIVALALAVKSNGKYQEIPAELHQPIDQALVVCTRGKNAELGRRFAAFMARKETRTLLESYGFSPPK
jgi:molybdate transport system substrate-binding protein